MKSSGPKVCARILGVLADETRLRIIRALLPRRLCVAEIAAAVALAMPRVSHHLAILRAAGIVETERAGRKVIYFLSPDLRRGKSSVFDLGCCRIQLMPLAGEAVCAAKPCCAPPARPRRKAR